VTVCSLLHTINQQPTQNNWGGKGFEIATNEYSMRGHGELCFNVSVSDLKYKRNTLVHIRWPNLPFFYWPFSQQTISFLRTTLAHLPAPTDYGRIQKYKRNILVHIRWPNLSFFYWPFSQQTISFLRTTLAHLPAPTDYGRPSHKYKPNRPSIKLQVDPTLKTSHTTDVTKLRFHMTSHFRMSRTHTHRTHT
jgi:hypothetical protein